MDSLKTAATNFLLTSRFPIQENFPPPTIDIQYNIIQKNENKHNGKTHERQHTTQHDSQQSRNISQFDESSHSSIENPIQYSLPLYPALTPHSNFVQLILHQQQQHQTELAKQQQATINTSITTIKYSTFKKLEKSTKKKSIKTDKQKQLNKETTKDENNNIDEQQQENDQQIQKEEITTKQNAEKQQDSENHIETESQTELNNEAESQVVDESVPSDAAPEFSVPEPVVSPSAYAFSPLYFLSTLPSLSAYFPLLHVTDAIISRMQQTTQFSLINQQHNQFTQYTALQTIPKQTLDDSLFPTFNSLLNNESITVDSAPTTSFRQLVFDWFGYFETSFSTDSKHTTSLPTGDSSLASLSNLHQQLADSSLDPALLQLFTSLLQQLQTLLICSFELKLQGIQESNQQKETVNLEMIEKYKLLLDFTRLLRIGLLYRQSWTEELYKFTEYDSATSQQLQQLIKKTDAEAGFQLLTR